MGILTLTARMSKSIRLTPQIYNKTSPKGTRPQMGSGTLRFGAHPLLTSQALPSGLSKGSHGAALDQLLTRLAAKTIHSKRAFLTECCDPSTSPGRRGNTGLRAQTAPGCPPSLQHPSPRSISVPLLPPAGFTWCSHSPVSSWPGPAWLQLWGHSGS